MAAKKRTDEQLTEEEPGQYVQAPACAPSGDYVILVNLTKAPMQCPLRTGRHVALGPNIPGKALHRSDPILKKDRTPMLFTWERKKMLAFEPVPGGESV